jgi:hypothetical protein
MLIFGDEIDLHERDGNLRDHDSGVGGGELHQGAKEGPSSNPRVRESISVGDVAAWTLMDR